MRLLAIDIGKSRSVACDYNARSAEHAFVSAPTTPERFRALLRERSPDRVVIEVCGSAGWIVDLCRELGIETQVANPSHDAWRWKNVKRKSDRTDALKLAQLSAAHQLPMVTVPNAETRQWRGLIAYRHKLVRERVRVKNSIRAILQRQGLGMPDRKCGWNQASIERLRSLAGALEESWGEDLWRGQLGVELERLEWVTKLLTRVTEKLDAIGAGSERVALLRTIPGVGPRLAEIVVATIDDPARFANGRQVGAYAGLAPRQFQSGAMDRQGRISGRGNPLLRALLVEVTWLGRTHNSWIRSTHDRLCHGSASRKKIATVAVARRLLVVCWAMLRDGRAWGAPGRVGEASGVSGGP